MVARRRLSGEHAFQTIEQIIGALLPASASQYREWWSNDRGSASRHCQAWLQAGWETDSVDFTGKRVVFRRA